MIWQCNDKYKGENKCTTPHVTEEEVKQKFLKDFNSLQECREELIPNCRLAQSVLCDCSDLDAELDELHREIEVVAELSQKAIYENSMSLSIKRNGLNVITSIWNDIAPLVLT